MFSREAISENVKALGIPDGATVLMHTSLRAIGAVEGGAEMLLDVLIEEITSRGGLFCVPTHTWHNLGKPCITLDMKRRETCLGTFPSIALNHPRAVRTLNPTHSMVIFGDPLLVKDFIKDEADLLTPTSPKSVYGKLDREDGYILLVGVGQNSNTYLHYAEELLGFPDRVDSLPTRVSVRTENGEVRESELYLFDESVHGDVSKKFYRYEPAFRAAGAIKDGVIGNAKVMLCRATTMRKVLGRLKDRAPSGDPLLYEGDLSELYPR